MSHTCLEMLNYGIVMVCEDEQFYFQLDYYYDCNLVFGVWIMLGIQPVRSCLPYSLPLVGRWRF